MKTGLVPFQLINKSPSDEEHSSDGCKSGHQVINGHGNDVQETAAIGCCRWLSSWNVISRRRGNSLKGEFSVDEQNRKNRVLSRMHIILQPTSKIQKFP